MGLLFLDLFVSHFTPSSWAPLAVLSHCSLPQSLHSSDPGDPRPRKRRLSDKSKNETRVKGAALSYHTSLKLKLKLLQSVSCMYHVSLVFLEMKFCPSFESVFLYEELLDLEIKIHLEMRLEPIIRIATARQKCKKNAKFLDHIKFYYLSLVWNMLGGS